MNCVVSEFESPQAFESRGSVEYVRQEQYRAPRKGLAFLRHLRELGPYLTIELVMPGGSLLAMLLWLYQRKRGPRLTPTPAANFCKAMSKSLSLARHCIERTFFRF